MPRLTDKLIKGLTPPPTGNRIVYDDDIAGFGIRITATGAKAYILNFRIAGRERRMTVASHAAWPLVRARKRAAELKRMVDAGVDPLGQAQEKRTAPAMADLIQRFKDDHLPKLRPKTSEEYRLILDKWVEPDLRSIKVAAVTYSHIDRLHRKITKAAPYRANRALAIISKMFVLAQRWEWCERNPAKGVERNQEFKRQTFLGPEQLARLGSVLAHYHQPTAANIVRLLLLTGARKGEVLGMRWDALNLNAGVWTKAASTTKQKREHIVPLSEAAVQLLREIRAHAEGKAEAKGEPVGEWVFPSHRQGGHRQQLRKSWIIICKAAELPDVRLHDLRHTFASVLASAGQSLPIVGALLGHSQPATTQRYVHFWSDPLKAATERASHIITGNPGAEVVKIPSRSA